MITICLSEGSFGEAFFFGPSTAFWLPYKSGPVDYKVHKHNENLNDDKWLCVSANLLTQWSEEE